MKKWVKWVAIVIVALGVIGIAYEIWSNNTNNGLVGFSTRDTITVEANPWIPHVAIPVEDSDSLYEVTWDQKYGATKIAYCKCIFRNEKTGDYRLIAPWTSFITIEAQNTNNVKVVKVSKVDVPDYQTCK